MPGQRKALKHAERTQADAEQKLQTVQVELAELASTVARAPSSTCHRAVDENQLVLCQFHFASGPARRGDDPLREEQSWAALRAPSVQLRMLVSACLSLPLC